MLEAFLRDKLKKRLNFYLFFSIFFILSFSRNKITAPHDFHQATELSLSAFQKKILKKDGQLKSFYVDKKKHVWFVGSHAFWRWSLRKKQLSKIMTWSEKNENDIAKKLYFYQSRFYILGQNKVVSFDTKEKIKYTISFPNWDSKCQSLTFSQSKVYCIGLSFVAFLDKKNSRFKINRSFNKINDAKELVYLPSLKKAFYHTKNEVWSIDFKRDSQLNSVLKFQSPILGFFSERKYSCCLYIF